MQIKIKFILCLFAVTFLIGLLVLTIHVKTMDCEDLLLVTPTSPDSSEINAEELERVNGDLFLLTYKIFSKQNIQALNANYEGTLIKTNFTYPFIMHEKLIEGSFFTEKDQKEGKKSATLNKAAAYAMFGNINICGSKIKIGQDEYTVTGVVDDKNEEKSVYIPASAVKENPNAFMVGLEDDLTREQIKNKCKQVVAEENDYQFVYFKDLEELVQGVFYIGLKLALVSAFLIIFKKSYCSLLKDIKAFKSLSKKYYVKELFRYYQKELWKMSFTLIGVVLMIILIFNMSFNSIGYFLFWHDNISILQLNDSSAFEAITSDLKVNIYLSLFFIVGFFISICLLLIDRVYLLGDENNGKNSN